MDQGILILRDSNGHLLVDEGSIGAVSYPCSGPIPKGDGTEDSIDFVGTERGDAGE